MNMKNKIFKVILGVVVFVLFVYLVDCIGSFQSTHVYDVEVIDNQIYMSASALSGYIVDTKLIEIEEGIYKIENKGSVFYGDEEHREAFDNSDGHIKEIRTYRSDYPDGYWVVYPIQEHGPFDLQTVSLMIYEDGVESYYQLKDSIDKDQFYSETDNYANIEKFLENTYLDIEVKTSYTISFKTYCGKIYEYVFFNGYLRDEKMNYLYQVDHYEQVEDWIINSFI